MNAARLNSAMAQYMNSAKLAPKVVVEAQAGILMRELAEDSAPENRATLERNMRKDLAKVYAPSPKVMLPIAHRQGKGFTWLMASPTVLLGTRNQNAHLEDSVGDVQRLFHRTQKAQVIKGKKYIDRGKRGRQSIAELNRIVVRRGVFSRSLAWLKSRAGILGGSWAIAWDVLRPGGRRPPAFKMRHVATGHAKGTYINGLGVPGKASFTLINRATGSESQKSLAMISGALRHRAEAMKVDMKNILRGAYKRAGFSKAKSNA